MEQAIITKKLLVGITGKARTGKDTIAKHLWAEHEFVRIAFADPLKEAAQAIFGLTEEQTWDDDLKDVVIPFWGMSPRHMFQQLGTEAVKGTFGPMTWIKRWAITYNAMKNTDSVVVPDVRCDPEAQALRNLGGVIIEVRRDVSVLDAVASAHSSEGGLTTPADFTILNNGSIEDLHRAVDNIIGSING